MILQAKGNVDAKYENASKPPPRFRHLNLTNGNQDIFSMRQQVLTATRTIIATHGKNKTELENGIHQQTPISAYNPNVDSEQSTARHEKILDNEYNSCQRGINNIQIIIINCTKTHNRDILRAIYIIIGFLYFAYFAYAMYYRFGDEGSIRLLVVTIIVVLLTVLDLTWDYIKDPFVRCSKSLASSTNASKRRVIQWLLYMIALVTIVVILVVEVVIPSPENLLSLAGLAAFILCCFLCSTNPGKVNWHPVFWGLALQFFFAAIILRTVWGYQSFDWLGNRVTEFLAHTDAGTKFVFNNIGAHPVAFAILPVVTFFSAMISILYYLGVMQAIVRVIGRFLGLCLGTTPAESLNAAGNIFVGMTEAPLMIKPFLETMTISELHAVMTGGFATIAGTVLAIYIGFGIPSSHVLSACVMSAPAALAISKLVCPETEVSKATTEDYYKITTVKSRNIIEAAAEGAFVSIRLLANIVVNLIAFLALLQFINATLGWLGDRVGLVGLSFELICSYVLYPVALFMGTALHDCQRVAELIGVKTFTNEFIAYKSLQTLLQNRQVFLNYTQTFNETEWYWDGQDVVLSTWNMTLERGFLDERSEVISTYALCGFSNIGSMGIMLGGLSALAPSRKSDLASIVTRAMLAGNIACFVTACVAGLFFKEFD